MKLPKAAVEACDGRADMYVLGGIGNGVVKAERLRTLWLARERSPFHIHDSKNDLEEVDSGRDGGQTAVS